MPTNSVPLWLDRKREIAFDTVQPDLQFDVAIIGAGMVGLHTALLLRQSGLKVAVLEAREVGCQATGRSTAKVTSQHGVKYTSLIRDLGQDRARLYANANEQAKDDIARLCATITGMAELETRSAFVYAQDEGQAESLREEADAAASLGLAAEFLPGTDLPFETSGLLRFDRQYQIDPYLYLCGVAGIVSRDGIDVFERSRVLDVTGDGPFELVLEQGVITAGTVVVATHMPVTGDGFFFAKAFPFAHPVAAAPLSEDASINGMFISAGKPSHSFRTAKKDGTTYLVTAGGEFDPGARQGAQDAIADMLAFLDQNFSIRKPTHLWINQDFRPMDGIAFIGQATSSKPRLLVATGFEAWGITQGVVAAGILSEHILERSHPAAALFDATRLRPMAGGPTFIAENVKTAAELVGERLLRKRVVDIADIEPGGGGVIEHDGEQLAIRKAQDGTISAHSAICTHLGCVVGWNTIDRTWDCACHGSRFDENGDVLSGPATKSLEARDAPPTGRNK